MVDYPVLTLIPEDRLRAQISFLLEIDKLKSVLRRTRLVNGARFENSAEHSWHISVLAIVLSEYSNVPVDVSHVIKMLLVHDIVEVDAGDTFCYDASAELTKAAREQAAADRLFGLLPADQAVELRALWDEFEARRTPEAKFAATMDRVMPILHNHATEGQSWREHGVTVDQVLTRNVPAEEGSERLWGLVKAVVADAVDRGYLSR